MYRVTEHRVQLAQYRRGNLLGFKRRRDPLYHDDNHNGPDNKIKSFYYVRFYNKNVAGDPKGYINFRFAKNLFASLPPPTSCCAIMFLRSDDKLIAPEIKIIHKTGPSDSVALHYCPLGVKKRDSISRLCFCEN